MSRPAFSPKELEVIGMYPPCSSAEYIGALGRVGIPESPRYNRPISPKQNWKLIFEGKKPYWTPFAGLVLSDMNKFRPRLHPDNMANHQLFDGEERYPFENESNVRISSWFDLEWTYEPIARGAMIRPGNPKVPDITKWEEYITIPDLDELDWEGCEKNNKKYLDTDRLNELGLQCSFWERLMSLMDAENAAIALIDEEQKEGVHRLFNELCVLYDEYIGRMKECCDIDCVEMHDDWGHQNGPFFSLETAREMLVPYIKRVADSCHRRGLYLEFHSCGKNEMLIPAFIETGADLWCGQADINDLNMLAHKYKDSRLVFGISPPEVSEGATPEEIRSIAEKWVDEFKDCRVAVSAFFKPMKQELKDAIYQFSRIAFQNED